MKKFLASVLLASAAAVSLQAAAAPIVFGGSTAIGRNLFSASASFDVNGDYLTVVLRNTSPAKAAVDAPGTVLSGLFWDLPDTFKLKPVSALLAPGARFVGDECDVADCEETANVGGEFGYLQTLLPGGADRGISSVNYAGFNFRPSFNGVNLDGPSGLGNINFGLVSAAEPYDGSDALDMQPLIQGAVVFNFKGAAGLDLSDIDNVSFQRGTALSANHIPASVPEPASLALLGLGLFGVAAARRRKSA